MDHFAKYIISQRNDALKTLGIEIMSSSIFDDLEFYCEGPLDLEVRDEIEERFVEELKNVATGATPYAGAMDELASFCECFGVNADFVLRFFNPESEVDSFRPKTLGKDHLREPYISQITEKMRHLHEADVAMTHGDISPDNVRVFFFINV